MQRKSIMMGMKSKTRTTRKRKVVHKDDEGQTTDNRVKK
jgi:hypothetical protein